MWWQVKGGIEPPSQDLQSYTLAFMLLNPTLLFLIFKVVLFLPNKEKEEGKTSSQKQV